MAAKNLPQRLRGDVHGTILLAFEDEEERGRAVEWLESADYDVIVANDPTAARNTVRQRLDIDVVVAERAFCEGEESLFLAASESGVELIMAGPADVFVVTQALAAGAVSFLPHPLTETDLMVQVLRAVQRARHAQLHQDHLLAQPQEVDFEGIVGTTPRMKEVMEILRKAAPTDAPIVILGESGTGKELIARAIHRASPRAEKGEFVALHLDATPAGLIESELFGHKKGAFTGALADRTGKLELANGGTLFLDELGDIPLETQTKLLRVLESRSFEPVGSNTEIRSDFRLIAATNQDIEAKIADKTFREELWYRLNVVRISLPPLRDRRADISLLADSFAKEFAKRYGKPAEGIDRDVLAILSRHVWKGNIRELRNVIQNMVVLSSGPRLTLRDVPRELRGHESAEAPAQGDTTLAGRSMEEIEREAIRETLKLTGGNRKAAADLLQIGERTLYRKIEKYDL